MEKCCGLKDGKLHCHTSNHGVVDDVYRCMKCGHYFCEKCCAQHSTSSCICVTCDSDDMYTILRKGGI